MLLGEKCDGVPEELILFCLLLLINVEMYLVLNPVFLTAQLREGLIRVVLLLDMYEVSFLALKPTAEQVFVLIIF